MSDTLLEPEDQISEHQVTKSGTCVIPGCPCRGWSAQQAVKEFGEAVERLPQAMKDQIIKDDERDNLRAIRAGEHAPAARGGGEWRVFNFTRDGANEWMVTTATGRTVALSNVNDPKLAESEMRQIATEHNQHHSLMAERERLLAVLQLTEKMFNYILELSRVDHIHTQAQQGIRAINDAFNEQGSTP